MSERYVGGVIYNPPAGWSTQFSSSNYLQLPTSSALVIGQSLEPFCIEAWIYQTVARNCIIIGAGTGASAWGGNFYRCALGSNASVGMEYKAGTSVGLGSSANVFTLNSWTHVAWTSDGTTIRVFANGVIVASAAVQAFVSPGTLFTRIGRNTDGYDSGEPFTGYISNLRIVKGSAVYTSAFTPPTGALLPITNTSFLSCRYPTIVDGSTNAFTITNTGTVTVSTANPFPTSGLPTPALGNAGNGIYTMSQYATLLAANQWPAIDPYYKNVTLNLHGNAGTVLPFNTDASTNNFQVTQVGDARPSNYTPFITNGYWSNYFDGSGDYLSVASAAGNALGAGDFTIQFWFYLTGTTGIGASGEIGMVGCGIVTASRYTVRIQGTSTRVMSWWLNTPSNNVTGTTPISLGQWYHVALVRSGSGSNNVKLYLNGNLESQGTSTYNSPADTILIGRTYTNLDGEYTNGYISNLQMVVGTAVYTSAFTPPTTPLTPITNTSLLTCQSSRFIDNSANAFTITPNGDTAVNPFQPFTAPTGTSAYGSGYFDGSGDYLTVTGSALDASTTTDYTVEFWMYTAKTGSAQMIYELGTGATNDLQIYVSTTALVFQVDGNSPTATVSFTDNSWVHVACVKAGGTLTTYINGVGTTVDTGVTVTSKTTAYIGMRAGSSLPFAGYLSNMRVNRSAVYTSNFTPPTSPLTAISGTSLLTVQTNAPSQNNTFLDSSTNNFLITRFGNTTQGTFTPYGSNWSNYFDGSGDYLRVAYNSNLYPTSSGTDYTVECWVYPTANIGGFTYILGTNNTSVSNWQITNDAGTYGFTLSGVGANAGTVVSNQWAHLAMTRNGTTMNAYLNGVRVYTTTASTQSNNNLPLNIGMRNGSDRAFTGYISNVRIVNGTALYTGASFTVPTAPLTAVTNTMLLTCADNRFIDDSTNAYTITKNGDTSVQRFSPFAPTSAYSTSLIGGSGYFDGSGDYLSSTYYINWSTFGSYTLEFWVYHTSMAAANQTYASTGGTGYTNFYNYSNGRIGLGIQGTNEIVSASGVITANQWYHVAYTYNGTTTTVYVNGVSVASGTTGVYSNNSAVLQIANGLGGLPVYGYMTDFRITKSVVYTGAFTPPTAPLAAIANTSLLLSYTNAAIFDNSMMTDWETLGSAQLNTAYKKYGSGSISMLATGDYCRSTQPSTMGDINGGDFTIEFWVYFTSVAADRALISKYGNAAENAGGLGYVVQWVQSSSVLRLVLGVGGGSDALYTWAWSPVVSTWYHVAVTRSGTSGRAFINGVQIGTTSTLSTSDVASPNATQIGKTHTVGQYLLGYMDDVRVTKGVARYTANFTPPTSQLQDQ